MFVCFYFFKQKTAYEMRISDWSSDVCSSDLPPERTARAELAAAAAAEPVRDRDQIGAQLGRGRIRRAFVGDMAGGGLAREMRSEERRGGKDVSVRVDLGGRRLIKKKQQHTHEKYLPQTQQS